MNTKEPRLLTTESPGNEQTRRRTQASKVETAARRESLTGVSKAEWQWVRRIRNADTASL